MNKNSNIYLSTSWDDKLPLHLLDELEVDVRRVGNKNPRDERLIKFIDSTPIRAGSNRKRTQTRWLSADLNELCEKLSLLMQEKKLRVGNQRYYCHIR